jgi:hypothetical protein
MQPENCLPRTQMSWRPCTQGPAEASPGRHACKTCVCPHQQEGLHAQREVPRFGDPLEALADDCG